MVNYGKSKIYKIESITGEGKCYIGSTTKDYLSQRMDKHRSDYKSWLKNKSRGRIRSYDLFDEYGIDNCIIILLEDFPCNSKDAKNAREGYYIKELDCVNKQIMGRTQKEYYIDNKDKLNTYQKEYNELNKGEILEYQNTKYICECGGKFTINNKIQHSNTIKHKKYLDSKIELGEVLDV